MSIRKFVATLGVIGALGLGWAATDVNGGGIQAGAADIASLGSRLQQRFELVPIRDGIVLIPRVKGEVRSIEVSDATVAVNGVAMTGSELREKLGADAGLVLQLSYLDDASRAELSRRQDGRAAEPSRPAESARRARRGGSNRDLFRFGGKITVTADEKIAGDVVAIAGDADVDGTVEGDVVVIGGVARLGPHADVRRDLTVIGTLDKDPGAVVGGEVHEVAFDVLRHSGSWRSRFPDRWPFSAFRPSVRFAGTIMRLALLVLLAWFVMLIARTPVQRIAERAAAEPVKAGLVGLLLELVFVPAILTSVIVLAISIIGIPLLPLVPVAAVGFALVLLVGFTAVAMQVGRMAEQRFGWSAHEPYVAAALGIVVIVTPLVLGRLIGFAPGFGIVAGVFVALGVLLEYVGWTVGLGAAALVRFAPAPPGAATVVPGAS